MVLKVGSWLGCSKGTSEQHGDNQAALHSAATPLAVLRPALEPLAQKGHGPTGEGPAEATKMDGRAGSPLL